MERRTLLKTVGSIGAASAVGGAGLMATTGGAAAAEIGEFEISDTEVVTDEGTIDTFTVSPNISVEYDGLDEDAAGLIAQFGIVTPEESEHAGTNTALSTYTSNPNLRVDLEDSENLDTRAGRYTWDELGPFSCLPKNNPDLTADFSEADGNQSITWTYYDAAKFSDEEDRDEDGNLLEQKYTKTEVEFYAMAAIVPAGDGRMVSPPGYIYDSGTMEVKVKNQPATGTVGVDGDSDATGENQSP